MKFRLLGTGLIAFGCLAVASIVYGQTVTLGQTAKFHGLITARNGADMTVRSETGDNIVVVLTDNTKVDVKEGLFGARKKQAAVMGLIPGLKVDVHGVGDQGGRVIATSVSFSGKDLEAAQAIQAGLAPTQKQLQTTDQKVADNQKAIQSNQQQIKQVAGDEADLAKRFGELGDYDVKHEAVVYFAVGKTDISAEGKQDLSKLAQQARALQGYLIEVEGFADSSGNAALNEKLSLERSQAVVDYLTEAGSISPLHMLAPGAMGTTKPVASNESAQGRAENRRVVAKVLVNRGLAKH
jgi:OmpA-OmpF porin, OOP family